jgi:hypothetical protein
MILSLGLSVRGRFELYIAFSLSDTSTASTSMAKQRMEHLQVSHLPRSESSLRKRTDCHCRIKNPDILLRYQFGVDANPGDMYVLGSTLERNHMLRGSIRGSRYCPITISSLIHMHRKRYLVEYTTREIMPQIRCQAALASLEKAAAEEGDLTGEQRRLIDGNQSY